MNPFILQVTVKYKSFPLRSSILHVFMIFLALVILVFKLEAQSQGSFTANGKRINVRSFNMQVQRMMDEVGIPGLSLAVIENGRISFFNAYGYKQLSKKDKVDKNTLFEACSLSKSFLVLVAHQLVDEGRLDLDKPIYQYMKYEALEHDPRYKLITPRMILSHSSGIENWKRFNNSDTLEILADPGEKYVYSGEAYNYLAAVIGQILNQSHEQYIAERIIHPLNLKRTYLKYEQSNHHKVPKSSPSNFAIGHGAFGNEFDKWKNTEAVPSSGYHLIAKDYARLMISIFDKKHLSEKRIRDILSPTVKFNQSIDSCYLGLGFAVIYGKNDTIITQGGSNDGFKANCFYSVGKKSGFVFFANGDRGKLITKKLCEMTVGLDINDFLGTYYRQYPSTAIDLLKVYREKDSLAMFSAIEKLKHDGKIDADTWNELGEEFMYRNRAISRKLIEQNIILNPELPLAYRLLGWINMAAREYDLAYKNFTQAKVLNYNLEEIERDLRDCNMRMEEDKRRAAYLVNIEGFENATVQAEYYNAMYGMETRSTTDIDGGSKIAYISPGDWLDYKVNISATGPYTVAIRVSSLAGGGKLELRSGTTLLTAVDIVSTGGWEKWITLKSQVNLSAGSQTLRVYAKVGGFHVNWFQFSGMTASEGK